MINIIALHQLYKRREITKIQQIDGKDNPTDAITKSTPNKAFREFINSNQLSVQVEKQVQRKGINK